MNASNHLSEPTIDTANQLHRSALRLLRVLRATRPAKGSSTSKLAVLGRLYQDGKTTATALAGYLRIQPQSLTRLVADLERHKLITRRQDDADRRQSLIQITEAGTRLLMEEIGVQRVTLAETMAKELTVTEQELLRLASGLMDQLASVTEAQAVALGEPERCRGQSVTPRKKRTNRGGQANDDADP
jgi:DNA-binding MarR family transcriptional regulator